VSFLVVTLTLTAVAAMWGFLYESTPSGDSCWIVRPYTKGTYKKDKGLWYKGLAGTDLDLAQEDSADFESLHILYVLAIFASALGLVLAVNMWWKRTRKTRESYLMALIAYFVANYLVNWLTHVMFVRNRCGDHNVQYIHHQGYYAPRPTVGWIETSDGGAKWTKAIYLVMVFNGSFLTQNLLELVLLQKAWIAERYGGGKQRSILFRPSCARVVIYGMLICNLIAFPVSIILFRGMMDTGVEALGGEDTGEIITIIFAVIAVVYVIVHVYISVVLISLFLSPLRSVRDRWTLRKVAACTFIAILSTLFCYGNMALMLINAFKLLPVDSVINDLCLIMVSISDVLRDGNEEEERYMEAGLEPKTVEKAGLDNETIEKAFDKTGSNELQKQAAKQVAPAAGQMVASDDPSREKSWSEKASAKFSNAMSGKSYASLDDVPDEQGDFRTADSKKKGNFSQRNTDQSFGGRGTANSAANALGINSGEPGKPGATKFGQLAASGSIGSMKFSGRRSNKSYSSFDDNIAEASHPNAGKYLESSHIVKAMQDLPKEDRLNLARQAAAEDARDVAGGLGTSSI
jgi:hypothetical protein